jgi:hypothetical protein
LSLTLPSKGTLREEVCSRLIKPTTQAYLGNVELLTNITPHSPQPQAFRRSMGLLGNAPGASLEAFADIKAV